MDNSLIENPSDYSNMPKAQQPFELKVDAILNDKPSAVETARDLLDPSHGPRVVEVTVAIAAAIHRHFNKHNRDFSIAKATEYANAMRRGEWKLNHQGMASYPDNSLGDGQHRCGAIVISECPQKVLLFGGLLKEAADTIDLNKGRNAGDALQLLGIVDGKVKSSIAKTAIEYQHESVHGTKPRLSVVQVEKWVVDRDELISSSLNIGRMSVDNVSEPCWSIAEGSTAALMMLMGEYTPMQTTGFIASVQQGVATYPESPTVELARKLTRAKYAERRKDKLSKREKLALTAKAASLWVKEASVAKLVWNSARESLPLFEAPAEIATAA